MKKIFFALLLLSISCILMFSCADTGHTVTFMVDGEVYATVTDETSPLPQDPTKEGYIFDGWYTDDGRRVDEGITVEEVLGALVEDGVPTVIYVVELDISDNEAIISRLIEDSTAQPIHLCNSNGVEKYAEKYFSAFIDPIF